MNRPGISCDIFCRVVDNFGDIGVTWRLALQLTLEFGLSVRLIVNDLDSFSRLEPRIDVSRRLQDVKGVTVILWDSALDVNPAELVIEAFAVNLPAYYAAAMAALSTPPVWINLEYLSAESWVGAHHLLPSPHPSLPLTKHFFFPGFTPQTGGLIREQSLLAARDAFAMSNNADNLHVFMFGYFNAAGSALLRAMAARTPHVRCSIAGGELATILENTECAPMHAPRGMAFETISFVAQQDFDRLLWRHDVLFVRGEDSFVRAQWAAKPFIWQIYPQSEDAHWLKLDSFLKLYCVGLAGDATIALRELWRAWNAQDSIAVGPAWCQLVDHLPALRVHAIDWSNKLAQMPDLATNLLSFYKNTAKI